MRPGIGIDPDKDYLLDPQQAKTIGLCVCCGREIYLGNPHDLCWDCYDSVEDIDDESE